MKARVICIGDELIRGDRVNTNASMICRKLLGRSVKTESVETIGDDPELIRNSIKRASALSGLTVVSGGLGPTVDDITTKSAAGGLGKSTVLNRKVFSMMKKRMKKADDESVVRMSTFIEGAVLIKNRAGSAYGQLIENGKAKFLFIPGVPEEAEAVLDEFLSSIPEKRSRNRVFALAGIGETAAAAAILKKAEKRLYEKLSFYPSHSGVRVHIDGSKFSRSESAAMSRIISSQLGYYIYSKRDESLMDAFHRIMIKKGLTLSTAESCTGGMISKLITDRKGSSAYFKGGYAAYSNEMKIKTGLVDKRIIEKYGAVSREAAESMSRNAALLAGSDAAVSVTGIAGPGGGSRQKKVGLVYISTSYRGRTETMEFNFSGNRDNVRKFSAYYAVFHILRRIKDE